MSTEYLSSLFITLAERTAYIYGYLIAVVIYATLELCGLTENNLLHVVTFTQKISTVMHNYFSTGTPIFTAIVGTVR